MKKTLVALAAVSAVSAFAQTAYHASGAVPNPAFGKGVTITGGFDASFSSLTYKGSNSFTGVTYNSTSTSQITFVGIEDLGGGMKADFNFESDINPSTQYNNGVATFNGIGNATTAITGNATGASPITNNTGVQAPSTWGSGQVKVGLQTSAGYIGLGAINNAALDFNQMTGPFGTAWGSGYGLTQATVGGGFSSSAKVRYDNSVRYFTPTINGVTGTLTYRGKNSTAANQQFSTTTGLQALSAVQEVGATYMNGPLNLIVVNQIDDGNGIGESIATVNGANTLNATTSGKKYSTTMFGGNYTYGAATLYYGHAKQADDGATQAAYTTNRYSIKYAVSPVLNVMFTSNKATYSKAAATLDGKTTTVTGLGADYMLSKMTALTFRMDKTQDDIGTMASTQAVSTTNGIGAGFAGGATPSDNQRKRTAVGLRVNF